MSEMLAEPSSYHPPERKPSRWLQAGVSVGTIAALAAGCAPGYDEPLESRAGQVTYDADAFVNAATCAAKEKQPIDGAGMVWVTSALQDGIIRYADGSTVNCGPGGGLPADEEVWSTQGGKNTDAAAWIDRYREYVEQVYPATTFTDLSTEEIKAGALERIDAVPGETFLLLNVDGASERAQWWKPWTPEVEYEQIFPVVERDRNNNPLVLGVSIHKNGTKPTNLAPWLASHSAHGGELTDNNPSLEMTVMQFSAAKQ